MQNSKRIARRGFLRMGLGAAAASLVPAGLVLAQDNQVSEDDPTAKALGYKHNAADVDTQAFPKRGTDEGKQQFCRNCALYAGDGEWAPCSIFQNREVAGGGWCAAWVAKS